MTNRSTQEPCLWERQPRETEQAWEAFKCYRDMEKPRKVQAVVEKLSKSRQLITRWKSKWYWEDRVRAYDAKIDKDALIRNINEQRKMNERHTQIALRLQKAALEALEALNPREMSFRDIKEAFKLAAELERTSRAGNIVYYAQNTEDPTEKEDVVIYVPDNGLEGRADGDE